VFERSRLTASWEGFLDLDASREDFQSYIELTVDYPLSDNSRFIVKYIDGRLPPNFGSESAVVGGFSVSF
jgi:hypothetical protein